MIVLGGIGKSEALFDLSEFGLTESTDGDEFDILAGGKERHVVAGSPPTGPDEAEPGLLLDAHSVSSYLGGLM